MSDTLHFPNEWNVLPIGEVGKVKLGRQRAPRFTLGKCPKPYLRVVNIFEDKLDLRDVMEMDFTNSELTEYRLEHGDILLTEGDLGSAYNVGRSAVYRSEIVDCCFTNTLIRFRKVDADLPSEYFHYAFELLRRNGKFAETTAATTVYHLSSGRLKAVLVPVPPAPQQRKIARILTTVDNLIEKTEALIAKYQAIKQGMMHDLFTRGVDKHGHLRPPYEEAPELYKQSELGWIPKEWRVSTLSDVADSAIDGPFGSNLKTEHYVSEAGVRVIRLQNIDTGHYNDNDRAFISDNHAELLSRHRVIPGDVMVAGMGEDTHPVARACLYPADLPPAINKADCFRVRCKVEHMENPFLMLSLNAHYLRPWIERFAQGVTRTRINVRNLKTLPLKVPSIAEQETISLRIFAIAAAVKELDAEKQKLHLHKTGLMQDLLTGKVRVEADEAS